MVGGIGLLLPINTPHPHILNPQASGKSLALRKLNFEECYALKPTDPNLLKERKGKFELEELKYEQCIRRKLADLKTSLTELKGDLLGRVRYEIVHMRIFTSIFGFFG